MDTKVLQNRKAHLTFRKCVLANMPLESESSCLQRHLQLSGSQLEAVLPPMGQLATSAGISECHDPGTDTTDI